MPRFPRRLPLLVALFVTAAVLPVMKPLAAALADGTAPAAAPPAKSDMFEQTDRKRMMSMKLPRAWKSVSDDDIDPKALVTFKGVFGAENSGRQGAVVFYVENRFARAQLARAVALPRVGTVKPGAMRQGTGWAEGAAVNEQRNCVWQRFVERNGRVYLFVVVVPDVFSDAVHEDVEKLLDTATVTADFTPPSLGDGWTPRKSGEFDVLSDADKDREGSIKKACTLLSTGRDAIAKSLAGKPFDASRPVAWLFQNGQKFEDRGKAVLGKVPTFALYSPADRSALVSLMSDNIAGRDDAVMGVGVEQYVWQYFGGQPPLWVSIGLGKYGQAMAASGGKAKLSPDAISKAKAAIAAGPRRLDQWFDVANESEIKDNDQGANELLGWHWYFRLGKGARQFKKPYDAYLQALHDSGDPAVARKAFDGVNFEEMAADFKSWAADWK